MTKFVVTNLFYNPNDDLIHSMYMKVKNNSIVWVMNAKDANTYPSKYAAKKHLRQLDNVPEDIKIVELDGV